MSQSTSTRSSSRRVRTTETSINFYEVFGVDKKATKKEIILKYRELVKKYHPDKNPTYAKLFEVIQRAWECLGNDELRKQYDHRMENNKKMKQSDFLMMKDDFKKFEELSKGEISDEKKKLAESEFKKLTHDIDEKIGYDRELEKEKLTQTDTKKILDDYLTLRTQDEIEYSQTPMFENNEKFDPKTFNVIFDKWKNKQNNDIIKKATGPSAFNDIISQDFASFNEEKEAKNINNNTDIYGSLDNPELFNECKNNIQDITPEELKKARNHANASNYDKHNTSKLSRNDIDKLISQRKMETSKLDKISFDEFINNFENSFNFTHEVNNVVGNLTFDDNDEEELMDACNKLIELERKDKGITGHKV